MRRSGLAVVRLTAPFLVTLAAIAWALYKRFGRRRRKAISSGTRPRPQPPPEDPRLEAHVGAVVSLHGRKREGLGEDEAGVRTAYVLPGDTLTTVPYFMPDRVSFAVTFFVIVAVALAAASDSDGNISMRAVLLALCVGAALGQTVSWSIILFSGPLAEAVHASVEIDSASAAALWQASYAWVSSPPAGKTRGFAQRAELGLVVEADLQDSSGGDGSSHPREFQAFVLEPCRRTGTSSEALTVHYYDSYALAKATKTSLPLATVRLRDLLDTATHADGSGGAGALGSTRIGDGTDVALAALDLAMQHADSSDPSIWEDEGTLGSVRVSSKKEAALKFPIFRGFLDVQDQTPLAARLFAFIVSGIGQQVVDNMLSSVTLLCDLGGGVWVSHLCWNPMPMESAFRDLVAIQAVRRNEGPPGTGPRFTFVIVPAPPEYEATHSDTVNANRAGRQFKTQTLKFFAVDVSSPTGVGLRVCCISNHQPETSMFAPASMVRGVLRMVPSNVANFVEMAQCMRLPRPIKIQLHEPEATEDICLDGETVPVSKLVAGIVADPS